MARRVTLVDYGMCNLLNVARALAHCGAEVSVTEAASDIAGADRLVLPGVGAFADGMDELHRRGLTDALRDYARKERPFLGICVGMQMLFDASEEFGRAPGLSILRGEVLEVPKRDLAGGTLRVPHVGWSDLVRPETDRGWRGSVFEDVDESSPAVYFVHSFAAVPTDPADRLADAMYGGHRLCAAVQRGNVMGTQFHPERSGRAGLSILRRFVEI